jgi:hypothetical protein
MFHNSRPFNALISVLPLPNITQYSPRYLLKDNELNKASQESRIYNKTVMTKFLTVPGEKAILVR